MDAFVLWIIGIVMVAIGFAGIFLPVLPSVPFVFLGLLAAAWADGFHRVGWLGLSILGALTLLSVFIDFFASALGAKKAGASKLAIVGSILGTFVGLSMGFVGIILGPFVGAAIGEYIAKENWDQAQKVGFATWIGMLIGVVSKVGIVFAMIGVFVTAFLF